VHGLSSAAVAMAVTRACSRGELERCGCDRKVRGVSPEGELIVERPSTHVSVCLSVVMNRKHMIDIFLTIMC